MCAVTTEQIRRIDNTAIHGLHIQSLLLMENAAGKTAEAVAELLAGKGSPRVLVVCGTGNNGGDGLACARLLLGQGFAVSTVLVGNAEKLTPDAAENHRRLLGSGGSIVPFSGQSFRGFDCIVDALFGFGLNRAVTGFYRQAIEEMNAAGAPIVACDIPSGLNGDTGEVMGTAVKACRTVTFTRAKIGLLQPGAEAFTGLITVADIGIPEEVIENIING